MRKWFISVCRAVAVAFVAAACFGTLSCEKYALPRLECNVDTIWAPIEGGTFDITINSNVEWSFEYSTVYKWISMDVMYGQSDYQDAVYPIKVQIQPNTDDSDRICEMIFSSQTLSRTLVVDQKGPAATPADSETPEE